MVLTKYYLRIKRDLNSLHQKVSQVTRMDWPLVYIVVTLYHQDIEQTALLLQKLPLSSAAMLILGSSRGHFPDSRRRFRIFMWATSSTSEGSIIDLRQTHTSKPFQYPQILLCYITLRARAKEPGTYSTIASLPTFSRTRGSSSVWKPKFLN